MQHQTLRQKEAGHPIMIGTCGVRGVGDHGEDVLQDVAEVRLVEALSGGVLPGHVLQEDVEDLETCRETETRQANSTPGCSHTHTKSPVCNLTVYFLSSALF